MLASPLYTAVMEWVAGANVDVVKDAEPPASATVPRTIFPSRNWTVPVAVPGFTDAVNVTGAPTGAGFCEDVTITDEDDRTFSVSAADVADELLASPSYETVIEWLPTVNDEIGKVAVPKTTIVVLIETPLSIKWIFPFAVDGFTVAVNVTAWPTVAGLTLELRVSDDSAFTVKLIVGEVEEGRFILPEY